MRVKKRILAILLVLSMLLGLTGISAAAAEFPDLPAESDWSYAALDAAVKNGLLKGVDGKLLPGGTVSRAQFAAILNRAFGATVQASLSNYSDVAQDAWYYADMAKAVSMKTLAGSDGTLRPEAPITRQEAFVALSRALKLAPGDKTALDAYSDGAGVAPWAVEGMAALVGGRYIEGTGGMLNPLGTITRAELAQVLYKLIPAYVSTAGTYSETVTGNLMVNAPGVTLKGITVPGDLILGDGVGEGDVTLSGVTVRGRMVVRGGGGHSIRIADESAIGTVIMGKPGAGAIRLTSESGSEVGSVDVGESGDQVILQGGFDAVTVESTAGVVLQDATVANLNVKAEKAAVALEGKTAVQSATVDAGAEGTTLTVAKNAQIIKLESAAPKTAVTGEGKVVEALISGNDSKVATVGTKVIIGKDATGVIAGGKVMTGGETITIQPPTSGGGTSSGPMNVTTDTQFYAALGSPYVTEIVVTGGLDITQGPGGEDGYLIQKPVTIASGGSLRIRYRTEFQKTTLTVKNGGTLYLDSYVSFGGLGEAARAATLDVQTGGKAYLLNQLEFNGGCTLTGSGKIQREEGIDRGDLTLVDSNMGGVELLCSGLNLGSVDKSVPVLRQMCTDDMDTARSALDKTSSEQATTFPYYDQVLLFPEGGIHATTFTLGSNLTFGAWTGKGAFQQFIVLPGVTVSVPSGKTLTIGAAGNLRIQGTVTVAGTLTNNGSLFKGADGTLTIVPGGAQDGTGSVTANYVATTPEQWDAALADKNCKMINLQCAVTLTDDNATAMEKLQDFYITDKGSLTIPNGVTLNMDLGEGMAELTGTACLTVQSGGILNLKNTLNVSDGATFINKGTLTLSKSKNAQNAGWLEVFPGGSFDNTGTVTVTVGELRGYMAKSFQNSGTITLGAEDGQADGTLGLRVCTFNNTDGTVTAENNGYIRLENVKATGGTITGAEVNDVFDQQDFFLTCKDSTATITYKNYEMRVTDTAGLKKVMALEELPIVGEGDGPYIHVGTNFTLTESVAITHDLNIQGDWSGKAAIPYTLTVAPNAILTVNEDANLNIGNFGTLELKGTLINNGGVNVSKWEDAENAGMNERGGLLSVTGTLTNNRDLNVNGGTLAFKDGSITIEKDAYLGIREGGVLTVESGKQITNHGTIEGMDRYNGKGVLSFAPVTLPGGDFYVNDPQDLDGNDTSWCHYAAEVWSADDLTAALKAYEARGYAFLRIQGEFEWENGTLSQGINLQIDNYWNGEEEHQTTFTLSGTTTIHGEVRVGGSDSVDKPKLVIAEGAAITVGKDNSQGADAHMQNDGIVENQGTITVSGEGAHLGGNGMFTGTSATNSDGSDEAAISDGWRTAIAPE